MEDAHDLPPADAAATLSALTTAAAQAPAAPENREQREAGLEERSRILLRQMRREDAVGRWHKACPAALRETDWNHAELAPYRSAIDRVLAYQIGPKGLIASSPTGRGKSRAMYALMRRLGVEEGHDVRYWHAIDWFNTLQEHVHYGRDEARGWVETVACRHVVFIDDYGQEALQLSREDWAQAWFFRFLDLRAGAQRPLFLTTNLTADLMAKRHDSVRSDPLVRRLLAVADPVPFETADERIEREKRQTAARR